MSQNSRARAVLVRGSIPKCWRAWVRASGIAGSATCSEVRHLRQRRHGCSPGNRKESEGARRASACLERRIRAQPGYDDGGGSDVESIGLSAPHNGLMGDAPLQVKRGRKRRARSTVKKAAPIQKPVIALRTQKEKVQASCRRGSSPLKLLAACRRWRLEADSLTRCRAVCAPAAVSASQRLARPSETRGNEEAARCTCRYAGVPAPATAPSRRRRLRAVSLLATAARSGLAQVDSVANARCAQIHREKRWRSDASLPTTVPKFECTGAAVSGSPWRLAA